VFFGDYSKVFDARKLRGQSPKKTFSAWRKNIFGANNRTVATLIPENEHEGGAKQ